MLCSLSVSLKKRKRTSPTSKHMLICLISLIVQQAYDRKVMMAVADIAIASLWNHPNSEPHVHHLRLPSIETFPIIRCGQTLF